MEVVLPERVRCLFDFSLRINWSLLEANKVATQLISPYVLPRFDIYPAHPADGHLPKEPDQDDQWIDY